MRTIQTQMRSIDHLAFAPDGRTLFVAHGYEDRPSTVAARGGIDLWDLTADDPRPTDTLLRGSGIDSLAVNPLGRWVYAARRTAYGASAAYVAVGLTFRQPVRLGDAPPFSNGQIAVSPDGRRLFAKGRHLRCWNQPDDAPPTERWRRPNESVWALAVSPDGLALATLQWEPVGRGRALRQVGRVILRSAAIGEPRHTADYPQTIGGPMLFSPDGTQLVVFGAAAFLVYAVADLSARPRRVRSDSRKHFTAAAFHPSGKYLAATSNDETVKLYDVATWEVVRTFTWQAGRQRSVAFSPDGLIAAAGTDTGRVVLWDFDP